MVGLPALRRPHRAMGYTSRSSTASPQKRLSTRAAQSRRPLSRAGAPAIQISASLPLAGHVQLVSVGGSQTTTGVGCELCWTPNYSIHADRSVADALTPPTPIQFGTTDDRGTIGNLQVSNGRPFYFEFNSWWVGSPVSGYYVGPAVGS